MSEENRRILVELLTAQEQGESVALATVVKARGSVPRQAGAKMLVYADGRTSGTIGGGEMESRVIAEAEQALANGRPHLLNYSLVDPKRGDPGLCGGEVEVYLEPYLPPATVFIFGCGHVGQALAAQAHLAGFRVVVSDDRPELATPEHIPHADRHLSGSPAETLAAEPIHTNTFVALVTRNVKLDREILTLILPSPARYIGVMGSRRRWTHTSKLLLEAGIAENELARVCSPLGLDIHAETPAEIAVSIMAEIIKAKAEGRKKKDEG